MHNIYTFFSILYIFRSRRNSWNNIMGEYAFTQMFDVLRHFSPLNFSFGGAPITAGTPRIILKIYNVM